MNCIVKKEEFVQPVTVEAFLEAWDVLQRVSVFEKFPPGEHAAAHAIYIRGLEDEALVKELAVRFPFKEKRYYNLTKPSAPNR